MADNVSHETISPTTTKKYDVVFSVNDIDLQMVDTDESVIPDNLAKLSAMVIAYHRANGDLAWLQDMAHDAENNSSDLSDDFKIDAYIP